MAGFGRHCRFVSHTESGSQLGSNSLESVAPIIRQRCTNHDPYYRDVFRRPLFSERYVIPLSVMSHTDVLINRYRRRLVFSARHTAVAASYYVARAVQSWESLGYSLC